MSPFKETPWQPKHHDSEPKSHDVPGAVTGPKLMVEGWIIEKRKKKSNQVILSLLLCSKSVDRLTTLPLNSLQIKAVG